MHYDLIIIGGGLVGAGLARALSATPLKIALIDAQLSKNEDQRLFALSASTCQFLQNIGAWLALAPYATPINKVHVSNKNHFGSLVLHHLDIHLPYLGHVIPAKEIEKLFTQDLKQQSNLTWYCPAVFKKLNLTERTVTIEASGEEKILHADLIVGADGAQSSVREQLAIDIKKVDYQQTAIVTKTNLYRSHRHVAYERFTSRGAIAMLPLKEDLCATIWSVDHAASLELMLLDDESFTHFLQKEFGYRLGRFQGIHVRYTYPLKLMYAGEIFKKNVLLIGNAAHSFHPIAAQGFNLAIYEVAALVEEIQQKITQHQSLATLDLKRFSDRTRIQRRFSLEISHCLAQMMSMDSLYIKPLLSLGMTGFNFAKSMKKAMIKRMIARAGVTPSLLLGM